MKHEQIKAQLEHVLTHTDYDFLGEKYEGKVRDCYTSGDVRFLVTTDRFSAFDVVLTSIPFKGQTLNQLAVKWFEMSKNIVPNHIIDVPDPNVMVARNCEILPVEVIVRDYLAGSAWRDYAAGNSISGIRLPKGMRSCEKLPKTILTPSTKADKGKHDLPISEDEILKRELVDSKIWEEIKEIAFSLFALGREHAKSQGLILVDTKYEFGLLNGEIILADEIHTQDSSRYWIAETYRELFEADQPQQMLDKEPTRQWLIGQGYQGDGVPPQFTDEKRIEMAEHYINAYEKISGDKFHAEVGEVSERIAQNLKLFRSKRIS